MTSETKLEESFSIGQFIIEGFENSPTEAFFVEINLRKKKWLLSCSYNPINENIENHLETLSNNLALVCQGFVMHLVSKVLEKMQLATKT